MKRMEGPLVEDPRNMQVDTLQNLLGLKFTNQDNEDEET